MKIAILGYGVEGKSAERYFTQHEPNAELAVFERFTDEADLSDFDMIVRSPSINPGKIAAEKTKVTSGTQVFFDKCPAPIIGVTGTKGKGTTCSLIAAVLRAAGYTVHLVGNIGAPALDELDKIRPKDIVVYELSSFQLWDLQKSPQTAVVVHIEPDHLNVHSGFEEYADAKTNIARYQSENDLVVYDSTNPESAKIAQKSPGKKVPYPDEKYAKTSQGNLLFSEQIICSVSDLKIPGAHNQMNALAAIDACWQYTKNPEDYKKGFNSFTGLPHRLKFVREVSGINYYDDSISTTVGSTVAAIKAFDQPKVLILGGSGKGVDFSKLVDEIKQADIRWVILLGAEADRFEALLAASGLKNFTNLGLSTSMAEVVERAANRAMPGDAVILSPACASFDMFKSYSDRGDQFVAAVEKLEAALNSFNHSIRRF